MPYSMQHIRDVRRLSGNTNGWLLYFGIVERLCLNEEDCSSIFLWVKMISTHSLIVHQIIISIKYNMQLKLWMRFYPHNLPKKKTKTKSMNQERWKTRENWATEKGKTFHNYFIWHYYHYKTKDGQLHEKQMKIFLNIKLNKKKKTDLCTYLPICTCITLLYMKT